MFRKYRLFLLILVVLVALFLVWCGSRNLEEKFGECIIGDEYEELTQEEFTTYLQEAYGLDALIEHKVYHSDGNFQVDFKFSKDVKGVKEWQLDSARKFAIDKFYSRDIAKYDLWNYDVWLIEHLGQKSISVTYRLFIGNQLTSSGYYPG